jgi:hypothetical protein
MRIARRVGDAVAGRPLALVGLALGLGGAAHFATWTEAAGAGRQFAGAVSQGNLTGAAPELAAYAVAHPAYVAAVLVGFALVVRGE